MSKRNFRSGSRRVLQKRIVGGTATRYEVTPNRTSICSKCKIKLQGRNVKGSERIYGGNLCGNCTRLKLITEARTIVLNKE